MENADPRAALPFFSILSVSETRTNGALSNCSLGVVFWETQVLSPDVVEKMHCLNTQKPKFHHYRETGPSLCQASNSPQGLPSCQDVHVCGGLRELLRRWRLSSVLLLTPVAFFHRPFSFEILVCFYYTT